MTEEIQTLSERPDEPSLKERMAKKLDNDRRIVSDAVEGMADLLGIRHKQAVSSSEEPLLEVCRAVAGAIGMKIVRPASQFEASRDPLGMIARASRIRTRRVALHGIWWEQDNGPLVAFSGEGKKPVALLQKTPTSYVITDPSIEAEPVLVDSEIAATLDPFAFMFYRGFPNRVVNGKDIFEFALHGCGRDIAVIGFAGLASGLLGLLTPVATGIIFNDIIPGARLNQLFIVVLSLVVSAISVSVFDFARSIALLRLEGRMDQHVQGGVWDRLLELPVPFFRDYAAGDLADRAMGINAIRQILSGTTINAILSGVFSLFSLALLFWYSVSLAKIAILITLGALLFLAVSSYIQLKCQKDLTSISGRLAGVVLESITGIAKFRVSGSEGRVFSRWANLFTDQRRLSIKSRTIQNSVETFSSVYPVISSMIIFIMIVIYAEKEPLSTGDFLAFNSAFGQFLNSVIGVFMSISGAIGILPIYQRCKPILDAVPETDEAKSDPGELTGEFEVSHISFRYTADGPLVLDDVSLKVNPGEFVAMVGASGSGKSTLFRLLLGFEKYETGGIFFDGKDLTGLDIREVRRQMGVVLQNGQLMAGDIFTNIVGSSMMTIDDAWSAAKMAGLDQDIKELPMGMHTLIAQGGVGFSGGQRQRLLIARALVARPRILFFDEATSALDNRTQAIVNESLEGLKTTRVVIAHRLSTVINADRIYVLDQGRVVQHGSYDELMSQDGLFADLARRQLV